MSDTPRYILAPAGRGALLLELASGALVELNESAAFIWQLFTEGADRPSIVKELTRRYAVDAGVAATDVARALQLPSETIPPAPTDLNYRFTDDHYVFEYRGRATFRIDAAGDHIALEPGDPATADRLPMLLHAVAPKILSLRGHFVLHAGAVAIGDRVLAFSGLSGAGKSTTARAFAAAGAEPLCDDQLLVDTMSTPVRVPRSAEAAIDRWIVTTAADLSSTGRGRCGGLDRAMDGERRVLAEVGFLDRDRRNGSNYSAAPLTSTSAAGALFRNVFHGSSQETYWRRAMERSARVADQIVASALTPPNTVQELARIAETRVSAGTLR